MLTRPSTQELPRVESLARYDSSFQANSPMQFRVMEPEQSEDDHIPLQADYTEKRTKLFDSCLNTEPIGGSRVSEDLDQLYGCLKEEFQRILEILVRKVVSQHVLELITQLDETILAYEARIRSLFVKLRSEMIAELLRVAAVTMPRFTDIVSSASTRVANTSSLIRTSWKSSPATRRKLENSKLYDISAQNSAFFTKKVLQNSANKLARRSKRTCERLSSLVSYHLLAEIDVKARKATRIYDNAQFLGKFSMLKSSQIGLNNSLVCDIAYCNRVGNIYLSNPRDSKVLSLPAKCVFESFDEQTPERRVQVEIEFSGEVQSVCCFGNSDFVVLIKIEQKPASQEDSPTYKFLLQRQKEGILQWSKEIKLEQPKFFKIARRHLDSFYFVYEDSELVILLYNSRKVAQTFLYKKGVYYFAYDEDMKLAAVLRKDGFLGICEILTKEMKKVLGIKPQNAGAYFRSLAISRHGLLFLENNLGINIEIYDLCGRKLGLCSSHRNTAWFEVEKALGGTSLLSVVAVVENESECNILLQRTSRMWLNERNKAEFHHDAGDLEIIKLRIRQMPTRKMRISLSELKNSNTIKTETNFQCQQLAQSSALCNEVDMHKVTACHWFTKYNQHFYFVDRLNNSVKRIKNVFDDQKLYNDEDLQLECVISEKERIISGMCSFDETTLLVILNGKDAACYNLLKSMFISCIRFSNDVFTESSFAYALHVDRRILIMPLGANTLHELRYNRNSMAGMRVKQRYSFPGCSFRYFAHGEQDCRFVICLKDTRCLYYVFIFDDKFASYTRLPPVRSEKPTDQWSPLRVVLYSHFCLVNTLNDGSLFVYDLKDRTNIVVVQVQCPNVWLSSCFDISAVSGEEKQISLSYYGSRGNEHGLFRLMISHASQRAG